MTPHESGSGFQPARATDQLREQAGKLADDVRDLGKAAKDVAREKVDAARRAGDDIYEDGLERARAVEDQLVSYVRSNPIKAVLIAAAAGLVLGSLVRR